MGAVLHLVRVGKDDRLSLAVLSDRLLSVAAHFNLKANRTQRCWGAENGCSGCEHEMRTMWNGYLHVVHTRTGKQGILELTLLASNRFKDLFHGRETVRGETIFVYRERASVKSPVVVEGLGPVAPDFFLPPAKDPLPTLRRLWGNLR